MRKPAETVWVIIEGKSGRTNIFKVSEDDKGFSPGAPLPVSHRSYASGQEDAKIVARFEPKTCEARLLDAVSMVEFVFPDTRSPLSLNAVMDLVQEIISGVRTHGFPKVGRS